MTEPNADSLQAYLDGELPPREAAELEAWLARHPETAEKLDQLRCQDDALRQLWALPKREPVPSRLLAAARPPARRAPPPWLRQGIAAGLVFALGLGGGWYGQQAYQASGYAAEGGMIADSLPRQAAMAHVVYSPDIQRPVEIGADQEAQMIAWLSQRMRSPIKPPRLAQAGYELIGGRLLPGEQGPVAQFMYHDPSGLRVTLYVANGVSPRNEAGFHYASQGPVNVYYWWSQGQGYALSAGMPRERLAGLARLAQRQLAAHPAAAETPPRPLM
ncbi:anti-sigma factor [Chromobacterium sp. IIBBL 290-4]|uniref:anti-sigma factor family protein n=1 Tax=Chromobacterium sp. IIBBL 290-4 TaxID=2953890 RepID=UPI0020B84B9C|nr:anti-sigma factor [Chromobacterium sp. IIBBL 290-4]UTH73237.1 anti-sigma factor [Chromobacterium sp. IIBBL 290-4]